MGVRHDAVIIFGWIIDAKKIRELMIASSSSATTATNCKYCKGSLCSDCLYDVECPPGWQIVEASPYYDCPFEDQTFAISAILPPHPSDVPPSICYDGKSISGQMLISLFSDTALLEAGVVFAAKLGIDIINEPNLKQPSVFALLHIH